LSVATAVIVFDPHASESPVYDHVPDPKVAALPFTVTLWMSLASEAVPLTLAVLLAVDELSAGEVIAIAGAVVSADAT
jgi:ABC-type iron transport system FetAB permease component